MPTATPIQVALKIKEDTELFNFVSWFETAYTKVNPETQRKRKGSFKNLVLGILSNAIAGGDASKIVYSDTESSYTLKEIAERYKAEKMLSPELQSAKANLSDAEYSKLVELMEKAKGA